MHASYKIQLNYRTDGKNLPDNEKGKERMKKKYLSIILAMAAATTMFTGSALNVNAKSGDSSEMGVRTFSWTKLLFLNYVYTEMDSFHPTIF